MAKSEILTQNAVDQPSGEAHGNVTGQTVGTQRGIHVIPVGGGTTGPAGDSVVWDTVTIDVTGSDSDTYTYSLDGTDNLVVTVTYTGTDKSQEQTIVKSEP